ncbi:Transcription factor bHLH148 [Hirschfeldia incana]|nr:Transcription factor bHLH148 [Hirschfeldia incana]
MASLISDIEQPPTNLNQSSTVLVRKKKKSLSTSSPSSSRGNAASLSNGDGESHPRWRSEKQQRLYSSKLIQAVKQVRLSSSSSASTSSPTAQKRGKAVREAADRALAVSARGRTLWSRAILANRIKLKLRKHKRPRQTATPAMTMVVTTGTSSRTRKRRVSVVGLNKKSLRTVNRKISVLGRLVPGCKKESVPVILEEATDYIQALEMQVRAMHSLMELLSGSGSAPPPN